MPKSCKDILDKMVYKGAMTDAEREKIIRNLRTEDMVEVIRCKDCKYYAKRNGHHYCYNYNGIGSGDAFCSYAERRTDV